LCGAERQSLWRILLLTPVEMLWLFDAIESFQMPVTLQELRSVRKRKVLPRAKNPTVNGVNLVQVRANRVAVPRQVPQYGIV
jgi:hypothetical protein